MLRFMEAPEIGPHTGPPGLNNVLLKFQDIADFPSPGLPFCPAAASNMLTFPGESATNPPPQPGGYAWRQDTAAF
jgi:hypothetical protein